MPLPYKPDAKRMVAEWIPFTLEDASFERPLKVYLRPLLAIEVDKADESRTKFVAEHITGGFWNEVTDEWQKEPNKLMAGGLPVELTDPLAIRFFRIEAMQKPMPGMPPAPEDQDLVTVEDMAEATVNADEFWRGLDDAYAKVWFGGFQGKGWRRPPTSEPPQNA